MNAKELIDKLSANPTSPLDLAATSAAALPIILRALRLLAAAEANEGSAVDACVMEIVELVDDIVTAARLTQFYDDPRYKPWSDQVWRSVETARRTISTRRKVLERIATERNGLAARVAVLEEEAARWDAMIAAQERVASNERPPKMATEFVRELANMVQRDGALLPRMQIAGHYRSLASALDENARLAARVRELEAQVRIAAGMLSTCPGFSDKHPKVALYAIEIAARSK